MSILFDFSKKQLLTMFIFYIVYSYSLISVLFSLLFYCFNCVYLGERWVFLFYFFRWLSQALHLKLKIFLYILFNYLSQVIFLSFSLKYFLKCHCYSYFILLCCCYDVATSPCGCLVTGTDGFLYKTFVSIASDDYKFMVKTLERFLENFV